MKIRNLLTTMAMVSVVLISGCKKTDDNATTTPTVNSTNPTNNATEVVLNRTVDATFSEAMDPTTLNLSSFTLKQGETLVIGAVSYTGTTVTFTPSLELTAETVYTATISTEAKSMTGTALDQNTVWSFTTGVAADIDLPTVTLTSPLSNATNVTRNTAVTATFSEAMTPSTITALSFTLKQGNTVVAGAIDYSGATATFTPSNELLAVTAYTATITTDVKDLAGNALEADKVWNFTTGGTITTLTTVDLGTSANYVILAKTAITNISTSVVTGDLGLSPAATSYITGFALTDATGYATSAQITGKIYAADMADPTPVNLTTAVENMITAYNDAAGRPSPDYLELGTGNIGGKTLLPGLYKWTNNVSIPSAITISGGADDIWIFQIAGDLSMSSAVIITLDGGAQAKNIFWQIAGEATFGTTSHFEGIVLSMTGITLQTGASMNGRALAQTAVILDGSAVTQPQ